MLIRVRTPLSTSAPIGADKLPIVLGNQIWVLIVNEFVEVNDEY